MVSGIANWLSLFTSPVLKFQTPWPGKTFKYDIISTIAFISACDFQKGTLSEYFAAHGSTNTCGKSCTELTRAFNGKNPDFFAVYSSTDHVNMVALTAYEDIDIHTTQGDSTSANMFMSFRGTYVWDVVNSRRNAQDGLIPISLCSGCAAYSGMYKNFVSLRFGMFTAYRKAEQKLTAASLSPTVMLFGMSMGANMAVYSSVYLRVVMSKDVRGVYLLGGPRSGNADLRKFSGKTGETVSFAMYRDPIPHFPPRALGWRHYSQTIKWLYIDPVYFALAQSGEEPEYSKYMRYEQFDGNGADSKFAGSCSFYDISDHSYFVGIEDTFMASCGGFADHYMKNVKGTGLFL